MNEFIDLLAIAPWVLCPSVAFIALIFGSFQVLKRLAPAGASLLAVPPDWDSWATTHKGYLERRGGRLSLRCTLHGQHFELELPDSGGVTRATLTLDPPPQWVEGPIAPGVVLGPGWIQVDTLRLRTRWDHACRIDLRVRVDGVLALVERICQGLNRHARRLAQDHLKLQDHGFIPQVNMAPIARARALLAWSPRGGEPPPNPGTILETWTCSGDAVALSNRGWIVELAVDSVTSTCFEVQSGPGGGLGLSVVDMLLHTQGSPPTSLKDPALAEDLLWLLHGHKGTLNERHLRVWLAPGELGEGLDRAGRTRAAMGGNATAE